MSDAGMALESPLFDVYAFDLSHTDHICKSEAVLVEQAVSSVTYFYPSPEMPTCRVRGGVWLSI